MSTLSPRSNHIWSFSLHSVYHIIMVQGGNIYPTVVLSLLYFLLLLNQNKCWWSQSCKPWICWNCKLLMCLVFWHKISVVCPKKKNPNVLLKTHRLLQENVLTSHQIIQLWYRKTSVFTPQWNSRQWFGHEHLLICFLSERDMTHVVEI